MRLFVYSGNRADFGLLSPIIHGLSKGHEISLLVGGSHQEKAMGETAREVVSSVGDKSRIFCLSSSGSAETELFSDSFCGVSHHLRSDPPDFLILLGDRIETLGAAVAAHLAGVKIAHIHGGDRTDGSRDNASRHAISKLAHVHFPASETAAKRLEALGEDREYIIQINSPAFAWGTHHENSVAAQCWEVEPFLSRTLVALTFHPNDDLTTHHVVDIVDTLSRSFADILFVVTAGNSEGDGRKTNEALADLSTSRDNLKFYSSLGIERYQALLRRAHAMIGNSSSGIIEGPALGVPSISVGSRQQGRERYGSVIFVQPDGDEISARLFECLNQTEVFNEKSESHLFNETDIGRIDRALREHYDAPCLKHFAQMEEKINAAC